jgi:hypothetical protein
VSKEGLDWVLFFIVGIDELFISPTQILERKKNGIPIFVLILNPKITFIFYHHSCVLNKLSTKDRRES